MLLSCLEYFICFSHLDLAIWCLRGSQGWQLGAPFMGSQLELQPEFPNHMIDLSARYHFFSYFHIVPWNIPYCPKFPIFSEQFLRKSFVSFASSAVMFFVVPRCCRIFQMDFWRWRCDDFRTQFFSTTPLDVDDDRGRTFGQPTCGERDSIETSWDIYENISSWDLRMLRMQLLRISLSRSREFGSRTLTAFCLICNSWGFLSWLAPGLSTAAVSPSLPKTTRACWISPQPPSSRVLCARSLFAASLMEAPTRATTATGTLVFDGLCTSWTKHTCICTATAFLQLHFPCMSHFV